MAKVSEQFKVLASPDEVWQKVSDFSLWGKLLAIPDPARSGTGGDFGRLEGEGLNARIGMFHKNALVHVWEVTEWTPGELLTAELRDWNAQGAAKALCDYCHPRQAVFTARWIARTVFFSVRLAPADITRSSTLVTIELATEFTHVLWGPMLTLVTPLRFILRRVARNFAKNVPAALEQAHEPDGGHAPA